MNIKTIMNRFVLLFFVVLLAACASQPSSQSQDNSDTQSQQGPDLKEASKLNVELAIGYIKRGELDVARSKLEKAIREDGNNSDAYRTQAYLYTTLGMNKEAKAAYEKAIGIQPTDPGLHNSYGAFLCKTGKIDEALKQFKIAYSSPFNENAYLAYGNAGTCLVRQRHFAQAETMLSKALSYDPKLTSALFSMADLALKTKQYLKARAYIERYHSLHKPSSDSLWIQSQAERGLGNRSYYLKYINQLISDFPNSDEASWAREQVHDEQLNDQ